MSDPITDKMALEAYATMQRETGKPDPDIKALAAANKVMSACGNHELKQAYCIEFQMRQQIVKKTRQ